MFSPITAIACVISSSTVRPVAGDRVPPSAPRGRPWPPAPAPRSRRTSSWKLSLRATKSVSAVDLDQGARPCPSSAIADQALGGDPAGLLGRGRQALLAQPVDRPPRCRRRPRASALLQSIMPAPVRSRSSLTSAAVISAMLEISSWFDGRAARLRRGARAVARRLPRAAGRHLGRHRPPRRRAATSRQLLDLAADPRHLADVDARRRSSRPGCRRAPPPTARSQ